MIGAEVVEQIRVKYEAFLPYLNEQTRRVWAAIEARSLGYGGISAVSEATGLRPQHDCCWAKNAGGRDEWDGRGWDDSPTGWRT